MVAKNRSNVSDIFINYSNKLKRVIGQIVRPDDIDDIVQDTFVRSYEAELKQEIKYVRSYMLKTAKHLALNHVAKSAYKFNHSIEEFVETPIELISTSFESEFESKERFLFFCRATDQLSGSVRKCFILKKVYGLSQSEIAKFLNISESTVEKHVAKGLFNSVQYMEKMSAHSTQCDSSGRVAASLDRSSSNQNDQSNVKEFISR
ncbi:RNA polymerase sigma factor [Shewanella sp. D64]|uniref:RNA polymerase sigma factor n=1 Tax=unclassified Shewanella TaxID=196818 RepID=UPI0022BA1A65|nr:MULTISPECIES: RNA polymerase sigma factor [unclassified Shewanella]MEC4728409.1 RNA polymerase sigma factor [Shewanella sp. D64]MEC4740176.1 RNA polymerase sigma factor [Shewanella sp. E94]WBJ96293.1 RNA polymerase sigma factor [Shewanella sp. MTB7]